MTGIGSPDKPRGKASRVFTQRHRMSARSSPTPQAPFPTSKASSPAFLSSEIPVEGGPVFFHGLAEATKAALATPDEERYKTFEEWLDAVGPQKVRENLEERYDAAFGTKTFAETHENDDRITSWEQFDEVCRKAAKDETETCLDHMDGMVKLIRDQRALIAALFAKEAR